MGLPILKYLDILIGIAVVMLMGSVLVTAVTQFVLSVSYARARYLRDGLSSLIQQIDRERLPEKSANYIASRLLRNPLIGRAPSLLGAILTWIRNRGRILLGKAELPGVNPADVIQREELVLFLLQWAAGEGLLLSQDEDKYAGQAAERIRKVLAAFSEADRQAAQKSIDAFIHNLQGEKWWFWRIIPEVWTFLGGSGLKLGPRLANVMRVYLAILDRRLQSEAEAIRKSIGEALKHLGVTDSAEALKKIRDRAVDNERTSPSAASQTWYAEAIASTVSAQLLGRVNTWFDNVIARVSDNFSLEAKVWSAIVALVIAVSVQLDSLALLRRLEVDDSLRSSLVAEAQQQMQTYDHAQQKLKEALELGKESQSGNVPVDPEREKLAMNLAADARVRIAEQLAVMREPKFALVPNYFIWQPVARLELNEAQVSVNRECAADSPVEGVLKVDHKEYSLKMANSPNRRLIELATAIRSAEAPVSVRLDEGRLLLVAASAETQEIGLAGVQGSRCRLIAGAQASKSVDFEGLGRRFPGIFLSFVLLSLGGPFWYNTLKKALNFRSMLAFKDDEERNARQTDQTAAKQQGRAQT